MCDPHTPGQCEHDGDCELEAVALYYCRRAIFNADLEARKLCRRHALQRLRRDERLGYGPVVESLDQLTLF